MALSYPWPNQLHLVPRWHSLIDGQTKPAAIGDSVALSHPWLSPTCSIWCPGGTLSSMTKPNQLHQVTRWHFLNYGQTKPAASGDSVALSHPWPNQTSCIWCLIGTLASTAKPNQLHLVTRWHFLIHSQTKPAASGALVALSHPLPNQTSCIWCPGGTLSSMAKPN